jgi:hypothetical protein
MLFKTENTSGWSDWGRGMPYTLKLKPVVLVVGRNVVDPCVNIKPSSAAASTLRLPGQALAATIG